MLQKIFWFLLFVFIIYWGCFPAIIAAIGMINNNPPIIIDEVAQKSGGNQQPILRKKDLTKHPRSKSEAACIKILEDLTGKEFPTVNPSWLVWKGKTLELDGYNDELKLALEFSGPLHTKWNPRFEPYEQYYDRITKDVVKLRTCKRHKVNLIVIDMSLPRIHWRNYLMSRLHDIYFGPAPIIYIDRQIAVPDRNEQIEKELGLKDYAMASKI